MPMKSKKLIIICIVIFLSGVAGSLWHILKPHGNIVNIIQNGETLYTIDLLRAENQTIQTEYNGKKNIIRIENHEIFISDAECPDYTCVRMGKLSGSPIVCLPNKLVIEFAENYETDAEVK